MTRTIRACALAGMTAAALATAGTSARAETIELTIASSHPPIIAWVAALHDPVVAQANDRLAEAGLDVEIAWTEAYGGALYKFQDTLEAVEQGITDIGWVGTLWEDSKMPLQNVTYHTPFVTNDLPMLMELFNDLHAQIPELHQAWIEQNQILLGASGIESYQLYSKDPIETFEDLDGRKFMAAGAVGSWLAGTGAVGVNGGLPDFYNNIQTGVADGALIAYSGGYPFKLHEVAPYIYEVNLGAQYTGGMAMNLETWNSLDPYVQAVFMDLGRAYSQVHADTLMNLAEVFRQKSIDEGATIDALPDEVMQAWVDNLPDLAGEWADGVTARDLPAREILNAYMEGVRERGGQPLVDWDK